MNNQELKYMKVINDCKANIKNLEWIFSHFGPMIEKMDGDAYDLFESGYRQYLHYEIQDLENASYELSAIHRKMVERSESARKAAATRKANRSKKSAV
jgi:hypothetical protein